MPDIKDFFECHIVLSLIRDYAIEAVRGDLTCMSVRYEEVAKSMEEDRWRAPKHSVPRAFTRHLHAGEPKDGAGNIQTWVNTDVEEPELQGLTRNGDSIPASSGCTCSLLSEFKNVDHKSHSPARIRPKDTERGKVSLRSRFIRDSSVCQVVFIISPPDSVL